MTSGRVRARLACLVCRQRKVRCDVSLKGFPCTNCGMDRQPCTVRRRRPGGKADELLPPRPESSTNVQNMQNMQKEADLMLLDYADRDSASSYEAQFAKDLSGSSPDYTTKTTNVATLFVCYPFLKAPKLHLLGPQEAALLEASGSLHVPSGDVLDTFVRHYFLHVHPCLPLMHEAEFWQIYRGMEDSSRGVSILLFKAMLFAAASFVPLDILKKCGFQSCISARNFFHRSAELLYDFKVEIDPFVVAQAALLLSYHSSSLDQLSNTTWLSIAIQNARVENAHQYDHNLIMNTMTRKRCELKRLWWSCFLRDRNLSLGLRRPLQITTENFDLSQKCLTIEDLEEETSHSEVYSSNVKAALSRIVISHCQLAVAVTKLAMLIYPAAGFDHSKFTLPTDLMARLHDLDEARSSLQQWMSESGIASESLPWDAHPSVSLYTALTSLYCHSARIALCHQVAFLLNTCEHTLEENEMGRLEECKNELADSVNGITEKIKSLDLTGSARYLPINAVAYTMLPQILVSLNVLLSSTTTDKIKHEHTLSHFNKVSRLYQTHYDTAHVNSCIQVVLGVFESQQQENECTSSAVVKAQQLEQGESFGDLFVNRLGTYLCLSFLLDHTLSKGKIAGKDDLSACFHNSVTDMTSARSANRLPVADIRESHTPSQNLSSAGLSIYPESHSTHSSCRGSPASEFGDIDISDGLDKTGIVWDSLDWPDESIDNILALVPSFSE